MKISRHILVAAVSGLAFAGACAGDLSWPSNDELTPGEFASMSSARHDLLMVGYGNTVAVGSFPYREVQLRAAQVTPRTGNCPGGGNTGMTRATFDLSTGFAFVGTQKATECVVRWEDGLEWTFGSSGLHWAGEFHMVEWLVTLDARVTGSLTWAGSDKRGGCRVDLVFRERNALGQSDTLTVRGQVCGRSVDMVIGLYPAPNS